MLLSEQYTLIPVFASRLRRANLSESMIAQLIQRYHVDLSIEQVQDIQRYLAGTPVKVDLLVEWVLKSISRRSGMYPEDIHRFYNASRFYLDQSKTPKFKQLVQRYAQERQLTLNPKNILDFTLHALEDLRDLFYEPEIDPRVNQLESGLPDGASLFYNDSTYQIVEVTSPVAACNLARGTRWCTSDSETAEHYLGVNPLYIFYIHGKKSYQMHIDFYPSGIQLMDLRDREVEVTPEFRGVLVKSGLMRSLIEVLNEAIVYSDELDFMVGNMTRWLGTEPDPVIRQMVKHYPAVATLYAGHVIKGRFPEAEAYIAQDSAEAVEYSYKIIKGRFKAAEETIIASSDLPRYIDILKFVLGDISSFLNDYPNDKRLDIYRYRIFPKFVQYQGRRYSITARERRGENGQVLVGYAEMGDPFGGVVWADQDGHIVSVQSPKKDISSDLF